MDDSSAKSAGYLWDHISWQLALTIDVMAHDCRRKFIGIPSLLGLSIPKGVTWANRSVRPVISWEGASKNHGEKRSVIQLAGIWSF
jgi:hypothetical protein